MAAAHVFVADLAAPELAAGDRHHLERVLRLRAGEEVTASDGAGRWVTCRWGGGAAPGLSVDGPVVVEAAPSVLVAVAFAPVKGDRPEWAVQKLTELGVDRIVPLVAARSVVRWTGERAAGPLERWRRVAREAAMQSRRVWLPVVEEPVGFEEAAGWPGAALAVAGGDPPSLARPTVLVGPEGGWDPDELAAGLPTVGLGPNVLRTETAAVAAATLLVALRSGLLAPHR
ncbi:MAG: rRNA (uracil1498-N3)-methyltransferase [Actinomycetota bacterium]|jgi:16S rRNA (uracil1498-N3)-methyltransferase|nr:rRNA (uracil1498-N3)-methyltransferase [Actinomycetota bacterium]